MKHLVARPPAAGPPPPRRHRTEHCFCGCHCGWPRQLATALLGHWHQGWTDGRMDERCCGSSICLAPFSRVHVRRQTNDIPYNAWCVRVTDGRTDGRTDGVWHARSLARALLASLAFKITRCPLTPLAREPQCNAMAAANASCQWVNLIGQEEKTARACAEPCLQAAPPPACAKTLCRSRSRSWEGPLFQYQHRSARSLRWWLRGVAAWRGVLSIRVAFSWLFSRKLMSARNATQRKSLLLPRYFGVSVAKFSRPFGFELEEREATNI